MAIADTVRAIVEAAGWAERIRQLRLIPQRHGTADHVAIFAEVARQLYVPDLVADFAYVHEAAFYEAAHFDAVYAVTERLTDGFAATAPADIAHVIEACPASLLVFRTLLGFTKEELAHAVLLVAARTGVPGLAASSIDAMERSPPTVAARLALGTVEGRAGLLAETIAQVMDGTLFPPAPPEMRLKQAKPDTAGGWATVRAYARDGVPLSVLLHQRHYGGAFRQILDATSTRRGDMIEAAVAALFDRAGIAYVQTGSHNQAEVAARFGVQVAPAPDFVVFDPADGSVQAMLECKGTNNGGTARDKALRFARLRGESIRLNGTPLFAVIGGIGWARVNDALAPVLRDTDGRVFTVKTLPAMLDVAPFPNLLGRMPPDLATSGNNR